MGFRDDARALEAQLEATRREAAEARAILEQELERERQRILELERQLAQKGGEPGALQRLTGSRKAAMGTLILLLGLLVLAVVLLILGPTPGTGSSL